MKDERCSTPMTEKLFDALHQRHLTLAAAESMTGGLIADAFIRHPGASEVFYGSAVTYTDEAKQRVLKVSKEILKRYTAVSAACARAMAHGAQAIFETDYALATTGYAGPEGQDVGLCYIALATPTQIKVRRVHLRGNRNANRRMAVLVALNMLQQELKGC